MRLIYLDDAIEAIAGRDETDGTCNVFSGRQVIDILNGLPSAQPEGKTGHWVYYDEYAEAVTHTCSECGKRMTTAIGVKASFCWNCGAYMRG